MQPSVVSLQRRRDMLCINSDYSDTPEAESSDQPGSKSKAKSYRKNSKPCMGRDHNHTNPEYVWGDEGPVNERKETSTARLSRIAILWRGDEATRRSVTADSSRFKA